MRVVIPFLLLFIFHQVFTAREVKFDSLHYSPVESDLLDYGTLKLTKAKIRNTFYLNGNFTIKRMIGNEKLVKFEVWARGGGMLITSTHAFCEFTNIDKSLWPDLMKASTMPKNNPCPFPEGNFRIKKFVLNETRIPRGVRNGKYTIKMKMMEFGKDILSLDMGITLKAT